MRHAQFLRRVCGVILAGWTVTSVGCTHHHYYGNAVPACGPVTVVPGTVANGAVCEVPSQSGTVVGRQGRPAIVSGAPYYSGARAPKVVVSEPSNGSRFGRWHPADPDTGLATLKVEGDVSDSTTNR